MSPIKEALMSAVEPDIWKYRHQDWDASRLEGYEVEATDGSVGKVDQATADVSGGYIVVDTGPWIFGKRVLLPAGVIERVDDDEEKVYVNLSKEQIKNAPELDETAYGDHESRQALGEYYGRFFMNAP
jgi:FKBP-type peptidyl-prolyl cis-trans isomerase 2